MENTPISLNISEDTKNLLVSTTVDNRWNSFFFSEDNVSDDFMLEREIASQPERKIE